MLVERPRNWKWMVPAALMAPCLIWFSAWFADAEWERFALIPLCLAIVLGVAAVVNLGIYLYEHWEQMYGDLLAARNNTPEVRLFEAASRMHPDAVKALLVHRRTIWRLRYVPTKDLVDWVLDEAETVHAGFVDFVLEHSSAVSVMPKRLLSEGSKQFDPDEQATDYEQYDAFLLLLQHKLMVTQAYGNQSSQWLPPWSPASARHRFGLDEAVAGEPEEMSEALLSVVRAQSRSNGTVSPRLNGVAGEIQERMLDGLEQTAQMKVRTDQLLRNKS